MKVKVWRRQQKTHFFQKTQSLVLNHVHHNKTTPPRNAMTHILLHLWISNRWDVRVRIVTAWEVVWMEVIIVEVEMVKEKREAVRVVMVMVMVRGVARVVMVRGVVRRIPTLHSHRLTLTWFCYQLLLAIWTLLKEIGESNLINSQALLKFSRAHQIDHNLSFM